jgi:hypothetical protein
MLLAVPGNQGGKRNEYSEQFDRKFNPGEDEVVVLACADFRLSNDCWGHCLGNCLLDWTD